MQLRRYYQQIVGKLRHVALIMPSTRGLFSPVNKTLQGDPTAIIPIILDAMLWPCLESCKLLYHLWSQDLPTKLRVPGTELRMGRTTDSTCHGLSYCATFFSAKKRLTFGSPHNFTTINGLANRLGNFLSGQTQWSGRWRFIKLGLD
jgi:hypothetical protein